MYPFCSCAVEPEKAFLPACADHSGQYAARDKPVISFAVSRTGPLRYKSLQGLYGLVTAACGKA